MRPGVLIAGLGLAAVAAGSVVLLRRRDKAAQRERAARHGFRHDRAASAELTELLRGLTLMQVGHSRCMEDVFRQDLDGPLYVFPYLCETGVEQRRRTHRWVVAVLGEIRLRSEGEEVGRPRSVAVISSQDWLIAAARLPGRKKLVIEPAGRVGPPLVAIVEDEDEWRSILTDDLKAWLLAQPATRSWEIISGRLIGYDPGPLTDERFTELPVVIRQFGDMLARSGPAPATSTARGAV